MSNSCKSIIDDLKECIYASKCFNEGNKFGDCLASKDPNEIGEKCIELKSAYFLCKRGQV